MTGAEAKAKRLKLGMSQTLFWGRVGVIQTTSSRYEGGRALPRAVETLLHVAYGTEKQANAALMELRSWNER